MRNFKSQNTKSFKNLNFCHLDLFRTLEFRASYLLIFCLLATYYLLLATTPASAVMRSSDYELQMPNLNFAAGNVSSADFKLGFTGGQNMPGPYTSTGYQVLAGFWYLKTIIPFAFSLSNQLIEFGTLSAGVPSTNTTTMTVSAGGAGGYQVTVQEDHQMAVHSIGALIADTTGDNGDITESNEGDWALNTTYGFGYTVYGNDVPSPFPTAAPTGVPTSPYKQFADMIKNETAQVVMSSNRVGKNRSATLLYKINISGTQAAGRYHNIITYIATPTF